MRILFVADGRSPIALNWMRYFVEHEHEVHLVTTYAAEPEMAFASVEFIPVAFNQAVGRAGGREDDASGKTSWIKRVSTAGMRTKVRQWLAPGTLRGASERLKSHIELIQPDLIHALRIPFEGMLATLANPTAPLIVSVWGNDFTLHAGSTPWMAAHTRRTLRDANVLMADCERDIKLAHKWGFAKERPTAVFPGAGGIRASQFYPADQEATQPTVINARGLRAYVRNDIFFKAIPMILAEIPSARFLCPTMAGEPQAEAWVKEFGIEDHVDLLPRQTMDEMAMLYRQSQVAVSPAEHDGTPNTLLEAMASGCFPVAGDIESVREWITHEENGLLVDPANPAAVAEEIIEALQNTALREAARKHNQEIIKQRATYEICMQAAEGLYLGRVE